MLALSAQMDPARQAQAMQVGVVGCLLKGLPAGEVVDAIRAAVRRPGTAEQ